jgi:restriction system protein
MGLSKGWKDLPQKEVTMATVRAWLVHTPVEIAESVEKKSKIAIGWKRMGNLNSFNSRSEMREKYRDVYKVDSNAKISMGTGNLYAFVHEMKAGDYVLAPLKVTREVLMGRLVGDYSYDTTAISPEYPNVRNVSWLKKVSRDDLSQPFRNTIGGLRTVFSLDAHISEIDDLLLETDKKPETPEKEETFPPYHEEVQAQADSMISDLLNKIDPYDFQDLAAGLLRAMGFNVRLGPQGADGRVDITAYPDAFGFQSPRIKVQVKHRKGQASAPEVQQLVGAAGSNEALFVSTGGFTQQAYKEADKHSKMALIDRDGFIRLLLDNYDKLNPEYQSMVPLKRIYVPVIST